MEHTIRNIEKFAKLFKNAKMGKKPRRINRGVRQSAICHPLYLKYSLTTLHEKQGLSWHKTDATKQMLQYFTVC